MKRALFVASLVAIAGCAAPSELLEPKFDGPGLQGKADGFSSIETEHLTFGEDATAEFDRDFQYFAFEFEAAADAIIDAEVTQRGTARGLDTTMFVYRLSDDAEPARIGSDDDAGYGRLSRIKDFRLYSEGLYAIVVGTKAALGRGNFRVTLGCLSGECAPEEPAEPLCSDDMRRSIRTCLEEESSGNDYEAPMNEVAAACSSDLDLTFEYHCDGADAPQWCYRGEGSVVNACEAYLRTTFPSSDALAARVSEIDAPDLDELVDAAHQSEGCGVSDESGCTVSLTALSYTGEAPNLETVFALARARSLIGPGAGIDIASRADAMSGLARSFDLEPAIVQAMDDLGIDRTAMEEGSMFQDNIQWNHGDCQVDAAAVHDAASRTIMIFDSVWCSG